MAKKPKTKKKKRPPGAGAGRVRPLYPERGQRSEVRGQMGARGATGARGTTVGQSPDSRGTVSGRPADRANSQVVLAGLDVPRFAGREGAAAFEAGLIETADPADRAHDVRVGRFLLPAAVVVKGRTVANRTLAARPRRYPPGHINGAGLALDSQFDDLHQREIRLQGLASFGRVDPDELHAWQRDASQAVEDRFGAIAAMGPERFRVWERAGQVHRYRTKLDVKATKILKGAGYRADGSRKGGDDAGDEDQGGGGHEGSGVPDGGAGGGPVPAGGAGAVQLGG